MLWHIRMSLQLKQMEACELLKNRYEINLKKKKTATMNVCLPVRFEVNEIDQLKNSHRHTHTYSHSRTQQSLGTYGYIRPAMTSVPVSGELKIDRVNEEKKKIGPHRRCPESTRNGTEWKKKKKLCAQVEKIQVDDLRRSLTSFYWILVDIL